MCHLESIVKFAHFARHFGDFLAIPIVKYLNIFWVAGALKCLCVYVCGGGSLLSWEAVR